LRERKAAAAAKDSAMPHTHVRLLYHVVFSTKERRPLLSDQIRGEVHAYIGGILNEIGGLALKVGGVEDHVHLLAQLPASIPVADAVRVIKTNSSKWLRQQATHGDFYWQVGYAAFTVSPSVLKQVVTYIAGQEAHHAKMTYREELEILLRRHEVVYDERFVVE
jgi:putative transposase